MPEEKQEITLREFLDKVLKLNEEEWKDLTPESRERVLRLIDPENVLVEAQEPRKKATTEEEQAIMDFVNLPSEAVAELKPWVRNRLLQKATEYAQSKGKMV